MSKEKVILSFVAIILGLFVAGGAFYIYQMTRTVNEPQKNQTLGTTSVQPTHSAASSNYLIVQEPQDEEVFSKRTITVSGKTMPDATVILSTDSSDQVVKPSANGDFSLTQSIDDGVNLLHVTAIFKNGEEQSVNKVVTSTTEDF